ncbi:MULTISPECIES: hypothetical protein [unclassified Mesorhizobium]|uniref:hypothetical protein n=1 Tax=unclassified Mesorhizobium TaxID=325217 RepID=UPI003015829D
MVGQKMGGNLSPHFPTVFAFQQFCTAGLGFAVSAWIPDTLRSLWLAHEVENDEWHLASPPIANVDDLPMRQQQARLSSAWAICDVANNNLVILDLVSEP